MNFSFEENLAERVSVGSDDTKILPCDAQFAGETSLNLANLGRDFADPLVDFIGVDGSDESGLVPGDWTGLPDLQFNSLEETGGLDDSPEVEVLVANPEPAEKIVPHYLDDSYIVGPGAKPEDATAHGAPPSPPPRRTTGSSRFMSAVDVALTLAFMSGMVRLSDFRPKVKTSRRINHIVAENDSLTSIAEEYFQNVQAAWLILEINAGRVRQYSDESCIVVELKVGQALDVPSALDLKEFYQRLDTYPLDSQLVTIVTAKDADRENLESMFADVLGLGPQSTLLQV